MSRQRCGHRGIACAMVRSTVSARQMRQTKNKLEIIRDRLSGVCTQSSAIRSEFACAVHIGRHRLISFAYCCRLRLMMLLFDQSVSHVVTSLTHLCRHVLNEAALCLTERMVLLACFICEHDESSDL